MVSICAQELRHLTGEASRRPLSLTGGGRYDSPRFSAKYLMCTSTDTNHDIILHTELIQGVQRPGSRHCSLGCPPRTSTLITKKKAEQRTDPPEILAAGKPPLPPLHRYNSRSGAPTQKRQSEQCLRTDSKTQKVCPSSGTHGLTHIYQS